MERIRIGTRGSKLALWQANYVADLLRAAQAGLEVEVEIIKTKGDKILDVALSKIGDKGLFTKELEAHLLEGNVDLCVHSCKDMPTQLPAGLTLAAMPVRANPQDCIVSPVAGMTLESIPAGARVATGSLRRVAQLARLRPDVEICEIRGNVDTRISKVTSGEFDCAILAAAGIQRLGLDEHISSIIPVETMIPAVGQGAVVCEIREGDTRVAELCAAIADARTMQAVEAERIVLGDLEGGCQVPLGAHGRFIERDGVEAFVLDAFVSSLNGERFILVHVEGTPDEAQAVAKTAVAQLREGGAEDILEELR
ncbi:MAG: hydroxymethylbilane synthase [Eggerthellaceae bacterium]|nr:hydroxymethylbilane synthase [Eggerthellaceae bacterium]